jgi:replicative DNA helicase
MEQVEFNQTIDLVEQKLISELLNDALIVEGAILKLEPKDFINKNMATIFGSIASLHREGKHIDEHTVIEFIYDHNDMHFDDYQAVIKSLANKFTTSTEVSDHIELIKNASIKRQMDRFAGDLVTSKINFTGFNDQVYQ